MHIFGPASYSVACHYHRIILPLRYLQKDYPEHRFEVGLSDPSGDYDALWVYGSQPLSNTPEIASLKRKGVKIVYCLDDTYWSWPQWRHDVPSKEAVGMVDLLCELADHIVASTPALAEAINKPHKTTVGPNLLECDLYRCPTHPEDDGRIRIMWSGAAAHKGDLQLVDRACSRIIERYGSRVGFQFVGAGPDDTLRDHWNGGSCNLTDWFPLNQYWSVIRQVNPHIVLAPLVNCPFNVAKSNIRILESWAINAAVVASGVGEYRAVESEVDGLYAEDEDEWFDAMSQLIDDRQLRERLATTGYQRVKADFDWQNPNSRLKWKPTVEAIERLGR